MMPTIASIEPIWDLLQCESNNIWQRMTYSSSLSDREWEIIEPLLPKKKPTCPPTWSKRQIFDGIFYQLKNGCNWCDLPKDLPPYSTVFWHYKQWRAEGVIDEIMKTLHQEVRQEVKKNLLGQL
jgi:transposase